MLFQLIRFAQCMCDDIIRMIFYLYFIYSRIRCLHLIDRDILNCVSLIDDDGCNGLDERGTSRALPKCTKGTCLRAIFFYLFPTTFHGYSVLFLISVFFVFLRTRRIEYLNHVGYYFQ